MKYNITILFGMQQIKEINLKSMKKKLSGSIYIKLRTTKLVHAWKQLQRW